MLFHNKIHLCVKCTKELLTEAGIVVIIRHILNIQNTYGGERMQKFTCLLLAFCQAASLGSAGKSSVTVQGKSTLSRTEYITSTDYLKSKPDISIGNINLYSSHSESGIAEYNYNMLVHFSDSMNNSQVSNVIERSRKGEIKLPEPEIIEEKAKEQTEAAEEISEVVEPSVQAEIQPEAPVSAPVSEPASIPSPIEIDDSDVTRTGIDVSKWQGRIDWQQVKNSGVQFAIIKAGEGLEVESRFYENINNAKAVGMQCGVYWFGHASSPEGAQAEARACMNAIAGYQLEYPVVYDFEYRSLNSNPIANNKSLLTDTILAFLRTLQQNAFYSMFYTNGDFSRRYLELSRINCDYDIWCANYNTSAPCLECGIWQHSETGTVAGMDMDRLNGNKTDVDLDISYKNYPMKMIKYHLNGF